MPVAIAIEEAAEGTLITIEYVGRHRNTTMLAQEVHEYREYHAKQMDQLGKAPRKSRHGAAVS